MAVYGPNMRHELAILLHGDTWEPLGEGVYGGNGHWIIYHCTQKNEKSPYWHEDRKEAVGGPKFKTFPVLIKTRRYRTVKGTEAEELVPPAFLDDNNYLYYIEHFIPVDVDDFLYEISNNIGPLPPEPPYKVLKKFDVVWVEPVLGSEGRVEYNLVVARDAEAKY